MTGLVVVNMINLNPLLLGQAEGLGRPFTLPSLKLTNINPKKGTLEDDVSFPPGLDIC